MPRLAPFAPDAPPDDTPGNDDAFSAPEPTGEVSDAYPENGLTDGEVTERVADGRVNRRPGVQGMRTSRIVLTNVLSPVNGIMLALFVLIGISGYWKDALFVGVVVTNTVVGITQELRARRELDQLKVLTEPAATVVRGGHTSEVQADDLVEDDLVEVSAGFQVVADGEVTDAVGLSVDESLLTGESKAVAKEVGDSILSGSFIVAGRGRFRATGVGAHSYAGSLTTEARRFSMAGSWLQGEINRIIHWLLFIVPPAALGMWLTRRGSGDTWQEALQGTVAAAVSMVPDGLVLLTSVAFVAGVVTLSRHKALAKQLATVESLARVDVLCMDKTGTITTGELEFVEAVPLDDIEVDEVKQVLAAIAAADPSPNATSTAIAEGTGTPPDWTVAALEPFQSQYKWAGVTFAGRGMFILGAPDVLVDADDPVLERVGALSTGGSRVLLLSRAAESSSFHPLPDDLTPVAIVELSDEVRDDAADVIEFFTRQGVDLKVISGDNIGTVSAVAERANITQIGEPIDARRLPLDSEPSDEMADAMESTTVFGRVTPHQKEAMVSSLQARGHVVAMTGDGVNDVMALKQADLGIAMGEGSAAARSIADLVLTDNAFATLPVVVSEGRKVINNVERVSNLFLTKSAYAIVLTVAVAVASMPFPLLPRQLTLIGTFSIGLPGFFLALSPEVDRLRPGFLRRVLSFALPAGVIAAAMAMVAFVYTRNQFGLPEARTMTTLTLLAIGLVVLLASSRPLHPWKIGLAVGMAVSYALICGLWITRDYFELSYVADAGVWGVGVGASLLGGVLIVALTALLDRTERTGA